MNCHTAKKIADEVDLAFRQVHAERNRRWRAENLDVSRASSQKWRAEHPDEFHLACRLWRYFNKERIRQYNREWRAKNPNYQSQRRARLKSATTSQGL